MAKRRAEDTLLRGSPSKRCYRSVSAADLPLERMAPTGGESPPSLLALMGGRKRPRHFEDSQNQEDAPLYREPANCDTRNVLLQQTSGGFRGPRSFSTLTSSKKRPRDDSAGLETVIPNANDKAGEDNNTEDCSYNSFQYWKLPLPELNLALLKDENHSKSKEEPKVKDFAPDAMET
ncbi:uncharacterized protein C9orf40 homolog [Pseudoliparis swirei]|uniref:uncharacterized protein C9orf40 homolog n=1 Tax=Pseudoliparis swirei TaxID=2059687 RepID=UPI0024BEEAD5|nr:uncharacterized protein C9orf40 homolog [Pseudoliparis swirei]